MPKLLALTAFLTALLATAPVRATPIDLVLVAGQSNAVGYDAKATDLPPDQGDADVLFWWRVGDPPPDEHDSTSGKRWTHLQPQPKGPALERDSGLPRQYGNFANPAGFGPEISFARTLRAKEKKPLAIVKVAFSGTGILQDWRPAEPGESGACYRALVEETRSAIAAGKIDGNEFRIRALLWIQGESDSNHKTPDYADRLAEMIAALRKDLDAPQMAALVGINTNYGNGRNAFMPTIVEQQKLLPTRLPRSVYVDTSGTTYANQSHFDTAGTLETGRRFAEALLSLESGANEPTNATEAAAKKAAQDRAVAEKYQAWKATLPPAQQAWETTLEQNLGAFYLPLHQREKLAGHSNAWDFVEDDPKLPRVLLIGDSVSRGYTLATRKTLAGKANVHRAPENCGPTANGIKKLDVWLGDGKWDVIHFNFGIHDRAVPAKEYEQRLETLVTRLQATGAKVVWASTTPIPPDTKDGPSATGAIIEKNAIAARVMEKHGVAIDDLFTFISPQVAQVQNPKDVHFSDAGYTLLGGEVARSIEKALAKSH